MRFTLALAVLVLVNGCGKCAPDVQVTGNLDPSVLAALRARPCDRRMVSRRVAPTARATTETIELCEKGDRVYLHLAVEAAEQPSVRDDIEIGRDAAGSVLAHIEPVLTEEQVASTELVRSAGTFLVEARGAERLDRMNAENESGRQ